MIRAFLKRTFALSEGRGDVAFCCWADRLGSKRSRPAPALGAARFDVDDFEPSFLHLGPGEAFAPAGDCFRVEDVFRYFAAKGAQHIVDGHADAAGAALDRVRDAVRGEDYALGVEVS